MPQVFSVTAREHVSPGDLIWLSAGSSETEGWFRVVELRETANGNVAWLVEPESPSLEWLRFAEHAPGLEKQAPVLPTKSHYNVRGKA